MRKSVSNQLARMMEHSDKVKRSKRRKGRGYRKGRNVGVLSKANGYRP